ncbi:hypothetical protein HY641_02995 [Candidatus Woesearchaeota archaeon]|nr:hypothetical protein [Candidatus Woesearchaeota archaeon]
MRAGIVFFKLLRLPDYPGIDKVRYRLKRLERAGIISGYTIAVDHARLGVQRVATYFNMNGMTTEVERRIYAFAQAHNIFAFVVTMIGAYDSSLEFETPNEGGIH